VNRLQLFPVSARIENDSLTIAGHDLTALAARYGTPLYLYDRLTMDRAVAAYRSALQAHYSGRTEITYAGKAFLCTALAQWTQQQKLYLDCTGEGESAVAAAAQVPREKIIVHGVNKSDADLRSALRHAGTIVVDNLAELKRIAGLAPAYGPRLLDLWLRLRPGLAVQTHHSHTQTGQHNSKFGMNVEELLEAAWICRHKNLPLRGIHFHQGSQFRDTSPLVKAVGLALDVAREIGFTGQWHLSPGGGWAVAYHEDELPQPDIDEYVRAVAKAVASGCEARRLALPVVHLEPGRSLVARAGVAVYRVGAVKRQDKITWLLTDGGIGDNPRYALYQARYTCLAVTGTGREPGETVSIGGPFCESGDVIIAGLSMPKVEQGELIAIPVSGAYQLSMASNYNGARRPAVLWLEAGKAQLIQRRETSDDLLRRDMPLD